MLKIIGFFVKVAVISTIAIIAGYWIRLGDSSLSDQVGKFSEKAKEKVTSLTEATTRKTRQKPKAARISIGHTTQLDPRPAEDIFPSEREKMREFIREIQGTHTARNQSEGR